MADRASVIPMRLTDEERSLLHVLEGALQISEYADKVDVINWRLNKSDMIQRQLEDLFAVLSGLMVAANSGRAGRELVHDREFRDNAAFFQRIFEIGRRFKCMNPDRMRSNFGKLVHLLQERRQERRLPSRSAAVRAVHFVCGRGRSAAAAKQRRHGRGQGS